jgi:hypothetical protein
MEAGSQQRAVNVSLAAFPGMTNEWAADAALSAVRSGSLTEPLFGPLHAAHVQLVPQSTSLLMEEVAHALKARHPDTRFRLHANVRVTREYRAADLANMRQHIEWFREAARISQCLDAPAYTAPSGRRADACLSEALDNARRLADVFDCPVGIEGQYPTKGNALLVATWDEYRTVLESGVPFAVDLSHLNILAHQSGRYEMTLVQEMLASERCIEVHVSDNDGCGDWHRVCVKPLWWTPLLKHINVDAVIFSEGNQRRYRRGAG